MQNTEWTNGFWTGILWLCYELTNDPKYRNLAEKNVESFLNRIEKNIEVEHHDLGFLYSISCVSAYKLTGSEKGKRAALLAADKLISRYQEKGEFIQAWGELGAKDNYRLIVDCLLNIPLLYWATEVTQDEKYRVSGQSFKAGDEIPKLKVKRKEQVIRHEGYTVSYNSDYRIANWVAYELTDKEAVSKKAERSNKFVADPEVKGAMATNGDYHRSGYDRGHQVPSGSRNANDGMNEQTFYFANMTVQNSDLNQTVWMELENMEREYALECDTLYVVTGPILDVDGDGGIARIEDNAGNKVAVPEAYFKVLLSYDAAGNTYRSIAFYYDNADCSRQTPHADDIRTVAQIEWRLL